MIKHLYNEIATRWCRGGNIWLYSDPHFSDEEMKYIRKDYIGDEEQIRRINSKVGRNDTIIFLGDIGNIECIKKIRGYKVLIMGNHDAGASNYQRKYWRDTGGLRTVDNYLFDEVYEGPLFINDKIILSHEPIDLPFAFNIHGHDHSNWFDEVTRYNHHLNVCAEWIDYTPVSLVSLLKSGVAKGVDDIHRMTIDGAIRRKAKCED